MDTATRTRLFGACRVLFDRDPDLTFLLLLKEPVLRAAWRLTALATHPDRAAGPERKRLHTERFIAARRAYDQLCDFVAGPAPPRLRPQPRPPARPRRRSAPPRPADPRVAQPVPDTKSARAVPRRRLRLVEYLYFTRVIAFEQSVEALLWQRRRRDRFCEVLVRWGVLDAPGARELLRRRLPGERVGEAARRLGVVTEFQVRTVIRHQRLRQPPIGGYFVAQGLLSRPELERHLRNLERHNTSCFRR